MLLGIDQSLTSTGITLFDGIEYSFELIQTEKTKKTKCPTIDYTRRLIQLKTRIAEIVEENNITHMAMEGMSYGSSGSTVFDLGGLSHLIRELFISKNIPFIVIPPKTLKKYWTGSGNANKELMILETDKKRISIPIRKNYGTKKEQKILADDNVVDSCALATFLHEYLQDKLRDYEEIIEKSWDL